MPGTGMMKTSIQQLSDYVWARTSARLLGLSDEEYLWEPVAGTWSIRRQPDGDGAYRPDWSTEAEPAPFTNIAWRMCHLIVCYGNKRNRELLGLPTAGLDDRFEPSSPAPGTAEAAIATLTDAHEEWQMFLSGFDDEGLAEKMGPIAGPFAEETKVAYVLHMLDEFIHHAAEIALLRDLWRAQPQSAGISLTGR